MNIFVTGSEGFIGSHLVEELVNKGHSVKCLVQYNFKNSYGWLDIVENKIKKEIEIVQGDIRDKDLIESVLGKKTEAIFNLAALIGIPYSYLAPQSYIDTNVVGALNILNAARKLENLCCFVQTSTSEVYGTPKRLPINEEHPVFAQSPYAASKIAADHLALSFHKSYGLPVSILRPFNTYGPRQSLRAIIPTIITQAINENKINLGSTKPTRDFVYVSDTVSGFIKLLKCQKAIGEIIQLGTGYEVSINHLIQLVGKLLKKNLIIKTQQNRKRPVSSEVERLQASNLKAKKILNWKPNFSEKSGLIKGLKITLDWYKNENNQSRFKIDNFTI